MSRFRQGSGAITLPSRLSYSSLSTYAECGEKWRLERGLKLGDAFTYWATVAGSAVHESVEVWARAHLDGVEVELPDFEQLLDKYAAEEREAGKEIRASGSERVTVQWSGGPDKKDRKWWLIYGPRMVQAAIRWIERSDWTLVGTEVKFDVLIAGEPRVGAIDLIFVTPEGLLVIVDLKTGAEPGGRLQLGTYRTAYREETGLDADWGYYLVFGIETVEEELPELDEEGNPKFFVRGPKKGQPKTKLQKVEGDVFAYPSSATDFGTYSDRYVESQYIQMRKGLENGVFIPNTRNNCQSCPVREYCRAVDGKRSLSVPVESVILPANTTSVSTTNQD